jgi:6-pyruvoyltetrahydropterin/6-carboxytetrahydropterin synthase
MWILKKTVQFTGLHRLPENSGPSGAWHKHNFVCHALVAYNSIGNKGDSAGLSIDFCVIEEALNAIKDKYLHDKNLNDTTGLNNPSCEELSRWIFNKLKNYIPCLHSVELEESSTASCVYSEA